jgi:hypothetical protein
MEEDVIANEVQRDWYTRSFWPKAARQQHPYVTALQI